VNAAEQFVEATGGSSTIGARPGVATLAERLRSTGWHVAVIDGRRCPTKAALLNEIAGLLEFPAWFGHNWDALVDCMGDAASDQRLAVIVNGSDHVGGDEPGAAVLSTLMSIVDDLAAEGTDVKLAARPFHGARR
jgi:hypothetical protein